jgi:hypothetical protein
MNKGRVNFRLGALTGILALGAALTAQAQVFNIAIQNSDFSENFTGGTITGYDNPADDIPGWSDAGINNDSGVTDADLGTGAVAPYAFVLSGDAGAIQVTSHTIGDGNSYTLTWDAAGVGETSQSVYLFSINSDLTGLSVLNSNSDLISGTMSPFSLNYTATATDAGKLLGIGFSGGGTPGGYATYDNFTANFVPVPEPAAYTLAGSLMLAGFAAYRRFRPSAKPTV